MHVEQSISRPPQSAWMAGKFPNSEHPPQISREGNKAPQDQAPELLLVEDQALLAQYMLSDLQKFYRITVADSIEKLHAILQQKNFTCAMVDFALRNEGEGLAAMSLLYSNNVRFLMFSGTYSEADVLAGMRSGASGFVHKNSSREVLLQSLQRLEKGEYFFSDQVMHMIETKKENDLNKLTPPQLKVALKLLDKTICSPGKTIPEDQQIADAIERSLGYTKNIIHSLISKLPGTKGTREMLHAALKEHGYYPDMAQNSLSIMEIAERIDGDETQ